MDLQSYRNFVRAQLDLEAEDLPDLLVDAWVNEAVAKIVNHVQTWPFYESSQTLEILTSQADYTHTLKEVRSVTVPGVGKLTYVDDAEAEEFYYRPSGVRSGKVCQFSLWGSGNIRFWPVPDQAYTATIRGYRRPTARLAAAGDEPDLPEDFHEAVLQWVLHKAYMREDDPELAAVYKFAYEELLAALASTEMTMDPVVPIVFNGGNANGKREYIIGGLVGPSIGEWGNF